MSSHEFTKNLLRNMLTCLPILGSFIFPTIASAHADKSKPAPTVQSAPAAAKPAPAPARPAPAQRAPTGPGVRQAPARPVQPSVQPGSNPGTGAGYRPPTTSPGSTGGGITGATRPNPGPSGGGITGVTRPNPGPSGGGITGVTRPNLGPSGGGITGVTRPNPGPSGGGITGVTRLNPSPSGGGATGGPMPLRREYHPGPGVKTIRGPGGESTHFNPRTSTTVRTDSGGRITRIERPGVAARDIRPSGLAGHIERSRPDGSRMVVERGYHGERRVEVLRPGGVRVVSMGHRGFVERPIAGRRGFVSRTYVVGGRTEVRVYREQYYGGVHYYRYVPRVYYGPAFYVWAYRPWSAPVAYGWGWGSAPWFYGGYFAPAPYYPNASLWLTDYLLAANLQVAYANRMADGGQGPSDQPPLAQSNFVALSPEVKQEIAQEVQQQLGAEMADSQRAPAQTTEGASDAPPALSPSVKIFVVSSSLTLAASADGPSCELTPGDIIRRTGRDMTTDGKVAISVENSKQGDCPVDFSTALDVSALQDMHNQFREQISTGLEQLGSDQNRKGLPAGPAASPRPAAEGQAPEDSEARGLLAAQNQEADQTEADIKQATGGGQ